VWRPNIVNTLHDRTPVRHGADPATSVCDSYGRSHDHDNLFVIEFRAEFFNLFNAPQFANPGNNVALPASLGVVSRTVVVPRIIQLAAKYRV